MGILTTIGWLILIGLLIYGAGVLDTGRLH